MADETGAALLTRWLAKLVAMGVRLVADLANDSLIGKPVALDKDQNELARYDDVLDDGIGPMGL